MRSDEPVVHIIDDSQDSALSIKQALEARGLDTEYYESHEDFVNRCDRDRPACIICDAGADGTAAYSFQSLLRGQGILLPVIFTSTNADFEAAIGVMKQGAVDFMLKPIPEGALIQSVESALACERLEYDRRRSHRLAEMRLSSLTSRERDVLALLTQGKSNKAVASELGLSPKTVEFHRGRIMLKSRSDSLADLVRTSILANPQSLPSL